MQATPFKSKAVVDYLFDFSKGVHAGIDYTLLPRDQLAAGSNTTVRGSLVGPRPCFRKITLTAGDPYGSQAALADFVAGRFQGACAYHPDDGADSLMASVSGHLYRLQISGAQAVLSDVSLPTSLNDASQMRNWLWQAEKWVIVTDGTQTPPLFYRTGETRRSNWDTVATHTGYNSDAFILPPIGQTVTVTLNAAFVLLLAEGDVVVHRYRGNFQVSKLVDATHVEMLNLTCTPAGLEVPIRDATSEYWSVVTSNGGDELPPGRMGCYGRGRVWMACTDGKQFLASDFVGGASGTSGHDFRDAVLKVTENSYLAGGGRFAVPGSYGEIRAMCFGETLDTSLGQGPLQVFTPHSVFSCDAPDDRTTWSDLSSPILTESAKGGGGLSQWGTINVNSDIKSRAFDGVRSLMLTRREFNTWGNVPCSREVQPQLDRDSQDLLGYESAVYFDNRELRTTEPELVAERGVVWKRLLATNFDTTSSLSGKAPAVYDALYWQGLDIFQLVKADVGTESRCFAFALNRVTNEIELWEILRSADDEIYDDGDQRIVWSIESPIIDFGQKDPRVRERLRMGQGELYVNDLRGKVSFQVFLRPEHWPSWIPWAFWEECSLNEDPAVSQPAFRPNMGLPEPDAGWCDPNTNRPLREGYFFQVKIVVTGHCRLASMKLTADVVPQPAIAPPVCDALCPES